MGVGRLIVWDFDVVEDHNIPNQMYPKSAIGTFKVDAFKEMIESFSDTEVIAHNSEFCVDEMDGADVLYLCVDSMSARASIHNEAKHLVDYVIDTRMSGIMFDVIVLNEDSTFYSDDDVAPVPCTEKAIIYNVFGVSSIAARLLGDYANGKPIDDRHLIFDYNNFILISVEK